jgi:alpha-D-ribose 1-methylphosphonate 5-phosphate C-P lyase
MDHPFRIESWEESCALCGATDSFLDEVIVDDKGRRMFVCSDTDYCEARRHAGHGPGVAAAAPTPESGP